MDMPTVAATGTAIAGLSETVQFVWGLAKPEAWVDMPAAVAAFGATLLTLVALWAVQWLPSKGGEPGAS